MNKKLNYVLIALLAVTILGGVVRIWAAIRKYSKENVVIKHNTPDGVYVFTDTNVLQHYHQTLGDPVIKMTVWWSNSTLHHWRMETEKGSLYHWPTRYTNDP